MQFQTDDYTSKLYELATPLFLYLVSFRRKVRKGYPVSASMVKGELQELFRRMEREAHNDRHLHTLYEEARYPLVVVADEVLLHSDWEHAEEWKNQHLLEQELYHSTTGGDDIFELASELEHHRTEMAAILFTALSLGSYHSKREKLSEVKSKLYYQLTEYLAEVKAEELTPQAYHVEKREAVRFSPSITLARVLLFGFGLTFLYYGAARISWFNALSDLRGLVNQVVEMLA